MAWLFVFQEHGCGARNPGLLQRCQEWREAVHVSVPVGTVDEQILFVFTSDYIVVLRDNR